MSLPCLVAEAIIVRAVPAKVHTFVPAAVAGTFTVLLNVPKCEKFTSGVVEYSVYDHLDSGFMAELCEVPEVLIGAKPAVHKLIISGIVAMGGGLKERSDVKCGAA